MKCQWSSLMEADFPFIYLFDFPFRSNNFCPWWLYPHSVPNFLCTHATWINRCCLLCVASLSRNLIYFKILFQIQLSFLFFYLSLSSYFKYVWTLEDCVGNQSICYTENRYIFVNKYSVFCLSFSTSWKYLVKYSIIKRANTNVKLLVNCSY